MTSKAVQAVNLNSKCLKKSDSVTSRRLGELLFLLADSKEEADRIPKVIHDIETSKEADEKTALLIEALKPWVKRLLEKEKKGEIKFFISLFQIRNCLKAYHYARFQQYKFLVFLKF